MPKVYVYNRKTEKVMILNKNDPRFDWGYPYTPDNQVKFTIRNKWCYREVANSLNDLELILNRHRLAEIAAAEARIKQLKSEMIKLTLDNDK